MQCPVLTGELASGPEALFDSLPHKSVLTLNVLPPEGWLVESVKAIHDLDNIKLEQVGYASSFFVLKYNIL